MVGPSAIGTSEWLWERAQSSRTLVLVHRHSLIGLAELFLLQFLGCHCVRPECAVGHLPIHFGFLGANSSFGAGRARLTKSHPQCRSNGDSLRLRQFSGVGAVLLLSGLAADAEHETDHCP